MEVKYFTPESLLSASEIPLCSYSRELETSIYGPQDLWNRSVTLQSLKWRMATVFYHPPGLSGKCLADPTDHPQRYLSSSWPQIFNNKYDNICGNVLGFSTDLDGKMCKRTQVYDDFWGKIDKLVKSTTFEPKLANPAIWACYFMEIFSIRLYPYS